VNPYWPLLGVACFLIVVGVLLIYRRRDENVIDVGFSGFVSLKNAPVGLALVVVGAGLLFAAFKVSNSNSNNSVNAASLNSGSGGSRVQELDPRSITASASSEHAPDRGITYSPRNTLDGNENTAWNSSGSGQGDWLRYEFDRPSRIRAMEIVNGYAKDPEIFKRNNRLRVVRIVTDDGSFTRTLRDTLDSQRVTGPFRVTQFVRIEIQSLYQGTDSTIRNAAVTEVSFTGSPSS
jgi:hypothetical protein